LLLPLLSFSGALHGDNRITHLDYGITQVGVQPG
jgi:hypothetical protein